MSFDLLINNGLIVDGTGKLRYPADLGINDGRISSIGRLSGKAKQTIDAEGHVVCPGFIDGHTHMDAQVFWDKLGSCSCYHGVTTVVMGNCGFTLAPCRESDADLVFRNLERAEDISREAMLAGISWQWETYSEYLDAVDATPKGINYSGYLGHSALRTHVMGERAFSDTATEDDLRLMAKHVREAMKAGAQGFTTSRSRNHETSNRQPVASRLADWSEVKFLVSEMAKSGSGIFEIAGEDTGGEPERIRDYQNRLKELAVDYGVPVTWGMFSSRRAPQYWRRFFNFLEEVEEEGGTMFAQVHSRALNVILSFESHTPFDKWDVWREIRQLPLAIQKEKLANPEIKAKLIEVASKPSDRHRAIGAEVRPPDWHWTFLMDEPSGGEKRMDELAAARGVSPVELFIDLALESDLKCLFRQPIANEIDEEVINLIRHPLSVCTFSDSGAHVSQIMDSSLQTHLLKHWVREEEALTLEEAIRQLTSEPARRWGFHDRGQLRLGNAADILVLNPDEVGPNMPDIRHDLPASARRLHQTAKGIKYSIVNGEILLESNQHSGAQPGQLLRATGSSEH